MKNIFVCVLISCMLISCSDSASEKTKTVDTTIIGSDNPTPSPDTATLNKQDTSKR